MGTIGGAGVIIRGPDGHKKIPDNKISYAHRRRLECKTHYEGPLDPKNLLDEKVRIKKIESKWIILNHFCWFKKAREFLKPNIPIEVPLYSKIELKSHFEYYRERNWIQNPEALTDDGLEEIIFLCGYNPEQFMNVCKPI